MKGIFLPLLLFLSLNSFSQQLVKYSIDKDVSINLPDNSVLTDTLGQKMIQGNIGGVNVIFLRAVEAEKNIVLENEADLIDFYAGFQKGYAKSMNGKIVNSKITAVDQLKATEFVCKSRINNLNITIDCLVVFVNNYAYSVQFFNGGSATEEYKTQKEAILSSLQFRKGLRLDNQLNNSLENTVAYKIGEVFGYFLGVAILIILILVILKKSKERKIPRV